MTDFVIIGAPDRCYIQGDDCRGDIVRVEIGGWRPDGSHVEIGRVFSCEGHETQVDLTMAERSGKPLLAFYDQPKKE